MVRAAFIDENGPRKGAWSEEEDDKLTNYIAKFGHSNWRQVSKLSGLSRCSKSCRMRWLNYLQPNIKHGNYSKQDDELIIRLHMQLGNKWSAIAENLPGRTDNDIENYWNARLKKLAEERENSSSLNYTLKVKANNGHISKARQSKTNYDEDKEEEEDEIRKNDRSATTDSGNCQFDHVLILESSLISSPSSTTTTSTNNDQFFYYLSSEDYSSSVPLNASITSSDSSSRGSNSDSGTNMINNIDDDFWTQPFPMTKDYSYDYSANNSLYFPVSPYNYWLYDDPTLDNFFF